MIVSKAILQILLIYLITPEIYSMHNSQHFDDPVLQSSGRDLSASGEVIFIHTDKDEYVAGEYLWYAAYLIDMQKKSAISTSNMIYIELLNSNNNPIVRKYIKIVNGAGHGAFMIPDTLGTGSYIIRAYTNLMKNFPPEQCFMKPINIYNIFDTKKFTRVSVNGRAPSPGSMPSNNLKGNKIRVETQDLVRRREKTVIDISFDTALFSTWQKTSLSISVSPWTGSERFPDICEYLSKVGPDTSQFMSERKTGPDLRYESEENGCLVYGRVISQDLNDSSDNKIVMLSVPGKGAFFQYAITDREGNFSFKINDDEFQKDLIFQVAGNPENDLIRISSSFWDNYADIKKISDTVYSEIPSYIEDWFVNYQVGRVYETKVAGDPVRRNVQKDFSRFYGFPDFELVMADYVLLPAMQEVFFELVPGVIMRTGRTRYGITVFNPRDNKPYDTDATLMVDGIIINDPSIIVEMNPENVERIDVVNTEYMVGGYHFYGIVNVVTKEGNFNSLPLPQNAIKLPFMDQEPERVFVSPDHSSIDPEAGRIPDYRNTLYWNPAVEIDAVGKARIEFRASDYISDYAIQIQGLTSQGQPLAITKRIRVE